MIAVLLINDVEEIVPEVVPVLLGPGIESLVLRYMKYVAIEETMKAIVVILSGSDIFWSGPKEDMREDFKPIRCKSCSETRSTH